MTAMATGLVFDERFLHHETGAGHPERPARLEAITTHLKEVGLWQRLTPLPFDAADETIIGRVHDPAYIARVAQTCASGARTIDAIDGGICVQSESVARLAAGGAVAAVDAVMRGQVVNAFCAVRPPGHHAERNQAMGFCIYNNVAIAAEHAVAQHGLERIAIVDFDVHHGNGTQHSFESRRDVLFISVHEHPDYQYPGVGYAHETGKGDGAGFTLNVPLLPHSDDAAYRLAFESQVLPKLRAFDPQLLFISAGFDAAAADPLGHMNVSTEGFQWMTQQLVNIANERCDGHVVSLLEGGYDLTALANGVAAHVQVLIDAEQRR